MRRRHDSRRRPEVESLESRVVLSTVTQVGDELRITGTEGADRILIASEGPDRLLVRVDGQNAGRFGPVSRIEVDALGGDDLVFLAPGVSVPSVLRGGTGSDLLKGGTGADHVFGDEGDDRLIASPGRDALMPGPGSDRTHYPVRIGVLQVGPSASGDAVRILARGYKLRPIGDPSQAEPGPVIIGASDLENPSIVDHLRRSYALGHTVSISNATLEEARRLRSLLGIESEADWDPSHPRMDLVSYRATVRPEGTTHSSVEFLAPRKQFPAAHPVRAAGHHAADRSTLVALSQSFSATPVLPELPPEGDSQINIVQVANSVQTKAIATDSYGDAIQAINTIWSARSFLNQSDFYYVLQQFNTEYAGNFDLKSWSNGITSIQRFHNTTLSNTSPQSNPQATVVTTSVSRSISGTVGWNQTEGLNASASGSVTITNSKSTTVPPIQIMNQSDFPRAIAEWDYVISNPPQSPDSITYNESWIWEVPFSDYGELNALPYSVNAGALFNEGTLSAPGSNPPSVDLILPQINASVPLPFGKNFSLQKPVITGLSSDYVEEGTIFSVEGTGLYPSLVTGVLIGGSQLSPEQYTPISDTKLNVVAPFLAFEDPVIVQTSEGDSNSNFTVTIY